jgi:hypothetical protein
VISQLRAHEKIPSHLTVPVWLRLNDFRQHIPNGAAAFFISKAFGST